jgi:hypothetical protein
MHIQKDESGQSTIEFVLSLSFALGITMLFVSQALNMTIGFMVHYGTFMAGRTYLTFDGLNISEAGEEARRTFGKYNLNNFDISPQVNIINKESSVLFTGVTAQYDKLLSPFRLILDGEKAVFFSEGLLGKEPTRSTCFEQTCHAVGGSGSCSPAMDVTLFDNGC